MAPVETPFKGWRAFLWPIHRYELKKVLPMFVMLFFICFNYSVVRNMKDTVVVTASGAEVIPFIKVWIVLPMAILVTYFFTRLSNIFSQERVFYIMTSGFLVCYALFAFILYPMRDVLQPTSSANWLQSILPAGFKGLISMYRNWSLMTFYVAAELWGTMILTVSFWGFANEVTRLSEARRFYSVFGIASNFATIMAGESSVMASQGGVFNPNLPFGHDAWEQNLQIMVLTVIAFGFATMAIFRWMNRRVLNDPQYDDLHQIKREVKKKGRLSFFESVQYVANSRYLLYIAIIVVAYNLVINMVEVVWKDQLRTLYPNPTDFNNYTSNIMIYLGITSTVIALFMAKIIEKLGWTRTALITPAMMTITCVGFFGCLFYHYSSGSELMILGMSPLALAVLFGAAQNTLSKACKYTVFDTTKEMAYIPLGHECKLKGKAAIDGVGSRFGKSGGSLLHQGLLMIFVTLSNSAPYVAAFILVAIVLWMIAVRSLGHQFNDLVASQESATEKAHPDPELGPKQEVLATS